MSKSGRVWVLMAMLHLLLNPVAPKDAALISKAAAAIIDAVEWLKKDHMREDACDVANWDLKSSIDRAGAELRLYQSSPNLDGKNLQDALDGLVKSLAFASRVSKLLVKAQKTLDFAIFKLPIFNPLTPSLAENIESYRDDPASADKRQKLKDSIAAVNKAIPWADWARYYLSKEGFKEACTGTATCVKDNYGYGLAGLGFLALGAGLYYAFASNRSTTPVLKPNESVVTSSSSTLAISEDIISSIVTEEITEEATVKSKFPWTIVMSVLMVIAGIVIIATVAFYYYREEPKTAASAANPKTKGSKKTAASSSGASAGDSSKTRATSAGSSTAKSSTGASSSGKPQSSRTTKTSKTSP